MAENMTGFLAPEGYEDELAHELSNERITSRCGRLFLVENATRVDFAWAQDVWENPREISIASIADGAKRLRELHSLWTLASFHQHRRANLIQAQLPKLSSPPLVFLESRRARQLGSWTLVSHDRILASPRSLSPFPLGEFSFREDKSAPSRAYLKLWELFTVRGVAPPKPGARCIDLGASPGGWTWVLAGLGCHVTAVDRSPLELPKRSVNDSRGKGEIEFVKGNAFNVKPQDLGRVDWLFSDVICYPSDLLELVRKWLASDLCANMVCTIKLKGKTDHSVIRQFAAIPGASLKHLLHNKHELTWWLARET